MKAIRDRLAFFPTFWIVASLFIFSRCLYLLSWLLDNLISNSNPSLEDFCQYDCKWYLTIINDGYMNHPLTTGHIGAANWAFFPFFPTLIHLFNFFLNLNPILIGIVLNNIFYFFFILFTLKYHELMFPKVNQKYLAYILSFSPIGIYINSLYTESLYLLLLISVLYCIERRWWFAIGILGGALSATRFTGVFMVILVLIKLFQERKNFRSHFSQKLLAVLLFPSGLLTFMIYLHFKTGDYLAFKHIQRAWGFGDLDFGNWLASVLHSESLTQWGYLISLSSALCLSLYFLRLKNYNETVILFIPFLISAVSVAINYRYFYSLYPYATLLALIISRNRFLKFAVFTSAPLFFIVVEVAWLNGAGYLV